MKRLKYLLLFILSFNLITSCFSDDDIDDTLSLTSEINEFVWSTMNQWYFWQSSIPDLSDTRFSNTQEFATYLNSFSSPNDLFNSLLFNEDDCSFIVEDFNPLIEFQQGISNTNGLEFTLGRVNGNSNLFGIVRLILPGSNASTQDIQRGDIFTEVNGVELTEANFRGLLFDGSDTFTLTIAEVSNGIITNTGETVTLTKEVYTENPVFIARTIDTGTRRVGYLMYNRFTNDFDSQLNAAFGQFIADGIEDLVLDLRYNPGGSVQSAIHLSSMITGQFNDDVLFRSTWNEEILALLSDDDLNTNFVNQLSNGDAINSLNLNRVFVLAQESTASASELVINSLESYINVIHIGNRTVGKNEFAATVFLDIPECNFVLNDNCNFSPNPEHTYAIQSILGRNANVNGFSDFTNGLVPDIILEEDIANFGVLGDITEPLLARALQEITSIPSTIPASTIPLNDIITGSSTETIQRNNMYITPMFVNTEN